MLEFLPRLVLIFILIFLNGFFVASEFSLVAIRKTRLKELAKKGNKRAEQVYRALKELDIYISSTQLGITLASLALGWIGEPALAHFIEPLFHFFPPQVASFGSHSLAVAIAFSLITFLHIVFGELAPKSLALQRAETTSMAIIAPLQLFTVIFRPFITLLNNAGSLVLQLFHLHSAGVTDPIHSEDEIKMILAQSVKIGTLEKHEVAMVNKVLQFTDMPIQQVITPRSEIVSFERNNLVKEVFKAIKKYDHSRYLVYKKNAGSVIGFVHLKDLYKLIDTPKENYSLEKAHIIREIIFAKDSKAADEVLYEMRKKRIHIAVIMDNQNNITGIVTLEDIVESIVGEI